MENQPTNSAPGILVVEDEALVARDIASRLRQLGYEVVGLAHNPRQAIEKAEAHKPDLLLCDIHLKDEIDGIDVARTVTENLNIPVIFLTAYSDRETVAKAKTISPYGYVLKPIETPDLQIAIEMAFHKFHIEQELAETRQLLRTALQCIGEALVFVDGGGQVRNINSEARELFGIEASQVPGKAWSDLLRLEDSRNEESTATLLENAVQSRVVTRLPPFTISHQDGSEILLDGIVGPTSRKGEEDGAVLILRELAEIHDPVVKLPGPDELPPTLDDLSSYPQDSERAFVLLLISPDEQGQLLETLEPAERDTLLEEISRELNLAMRSSDLAIYYGGTTFSASLPYTSLEEASSIADAILRRLEQHRFLQGKLSLTVSIGVAHYKPGITSSHSESPLELFRRANRALNLARQSGGNRVAIWRPGADVDLVGNLDSQSRLLAADSGQDYRNMVLLWNTMNSIANAQDLEELAGALVSRFRRAFDLERAALYCNFDQGPALAACDPSPENSEVTESDFAGDHCIPLQHGGIGLGKLYLVTAPDSGELRQQDLVFIKTLLDYSAGPMARYLSPPKPSQSKQQGQDPGSEVLYQSETMAAVMDLVRLVAPTEETVLVTGESGTGKELIARELHRLSGRKDKPFVIMDCGAVVSSLIESELFGHIKGAYTGATSTVRGKLLEADGGTLLLDEIGDLPLDTQVKLLRVVQEKQFTAVGSNKVQTVNTRIVAATNVDLEARIREGSFREDLFYRLNVINVNSPPLRDRQGDIEFLANHFLSACSRQYDKNIEGFTPAARNALLEYRWPGNIRELRNTLIRAVILCQDQWIDLVHLELRDESGSRIKDTSAPGIASPMVDPAHGTDSLEDLQRELSASFEAQVQACLERDMLVPLGNWLEQDLIMASLELHGQVNLQAAEALGIPESTLRRKLLRYNNGPAQRPAALAESWQPIIQLLPGWIRASRKEGRDPMQGLHRLLLSRISEQCRTQAEAAALVGVSPPTYRRQLTELGV
jgi:diguanylate cyclase (GGDEF)-like protein/PAS domain S-box-containing protein